MHICLLISRVSDRYIDDAHLNSVIIALDTECLISRGYVFGSFIRAISGEKFINHPMEDIRIRRLRPFVITVLQILICALNI